MKSTGEAALPEAGKISSPPRLRIFAPIPARIAADKTPDDRDRVVDAARAAALVVVVIGHGLMAVVAWPDGVPRLGNLLAAFPWTQALTWLLQIMPLFFFAGGAANALSWDRAQARNTPYANWLWLRAARLLRPTWVYLAVMCTIAATVTILAPSEVARPLMLLMTQLLWFLGAYLLVTALTPLMRATTRMRGALATAGLLLAVGLVDAARFAWGWPEMVGLLNFVLVWAIPAYLGTLRARGVLARYSALTLGGVVVASVCLNGVLIREGPWPISLVGMPGEPVSNMAPPSVVLALHGLVLACLLTLANGPLTRLLRRPGVWRPVVSVNLAAMTIYLWHLPVLIAVTTLAHVVHLERPTILDASGFPVPAGWGYALGSIAFWIVYLTGVWAVVRLMWPFELARLPWWDSPPKASAPQRLWATVAAAVGVAGVGVSTLVLSATGLAGFPLEVVHYAGLPLNPAIAITLLIASGALIRWAGAARLG